jgi:hypothetical protein
LGCRVKYVLLILSVSRCYTYYYCDDYLVLQAKLWVQAEECSKFADVEIEFSDGLTLRAHRCIITLASSCFDRMFDSGEAARSITHAPYTLHPSFETLNPKPKSVYRMFESREAARSITPTPYALHP